MCNAGELEYNVDDACNLLEVDVTLFTVVADDTAEVGIDFVAVVDMLAVAVVDMLARVEFDDAIVGVEFENACVVRGLSEVGKGSDTYNVTLSLGTGRLTLNA